MQKFLSKSILALAGISVVAFSSTQPSFALVPRNTAVITNTGSTNAIGYRIYISQAGQASYVDGKGRGSGTLSEKLAKKFFHDIEVAQPLSQLSVRRCMKSVSFGTSTYLEIGGERTPDLSCYGNQKAEKLFNDVGEIARSLHVSNVPRSQGRELPPQNF